MPRNELTKDEIKCHVLKLKDELYHEQYTEGITFLAPVSESRSWTKLTNTGLDG